MTTTEQAPPPSVVSLPIAPEERNRIIESMLPLVRHLLSRMAIFLPPHISQDDLVSAGVLGLIGAVDRFDPRKGASLKSFCAMRIRGAILDELRRLDWIPRTVHEDARRLSNTQEALAQKLGREPTEEEIRSELGLNEQEFNDFLERVKPASYFSLQEPAYTDDDGNALLHEEIVADPRAVDSLNNLLREEDRGLLSDQMRQLPKQQLTVLALYYYEGLRLREIAEVMSITESRVSQIHTLAINRLRRTFMVIRKR